MKNLIFFITIIALGASSCKKNGPDVTIPTVTTGPISNITSTSATGGGNVTSDGGDQITSRGVCWSTSQNPATTDSKTADGSGTGIFTSNITGLNENTIYYVRAYAINNKGTNYGSQESFSTSPAPVTDIDGNVYNTIVIGTQTWMKENLKTTKFRDNTTIPIVTDNTAWYSLLTPGYCYYENNETTYKNVYGTLYNWFAVNTDKLCPTGWHVPRDAEWTILTTFLGGENVAGGKLKETGFSHWSSPNTSATNEVKFNALPGGNRLPTALFYDLNYAGRWWSSTEASDSFSWQRGLYYESASVNREEGNKISGYSVRCIKD
jgi:uncharacterized protein (TIGR02145 family)